MRSEKLDTIGAGRTAPLQETVSGLNAVVMLGSFMHAAPSSESTAELAAGGLAALTRLPLAAVAWYADGPDGPLSVIGRCSGEPGINPQVATTLRRLGPQLHAFRPTRRAADDLPRALRRAGVDALLALPLRVSTESLGYLLVGGRQNAIPEDLTLIQALGAQTSTALYVACIRESEERRLQELNDLAAELRAQGELLARALRLQEELIDLVLRGKDARTIVEHLADRLEAPVWLLDAERRMLAHAGGAEHPATPLRESDLDRVLGPQHPDHDPRSVEIITAAGVAPLLVQSVATDRETFGYLMVGSTALGPVDRTTFHGGRLVLALRLLIERSVAETEERLGRDLIQDALLRSGGGGTRAGLAVRLGYEDDGPAVVLAMRVGPEGGAVAERCGRRAFAVLREELRGSTRGVAGMIGTEIVAIMQPAHVDRIARRFLDRVSVALPGLDVAVGLSDARPRLGALEPAFREARTAVAMAQRRPAERVMRFADLGLHRLLFDVEHVDRVDGHIERWIGPLLRYDTDSKARLVETLGCFLDGDGHQSAAKKLAIHPSTLKYRLGRIREVLGVDLADAEVRFNVELALRLLAGLRTLYPDATGPRGPA